MQKNDEIKMQFGKNLVALREREKLTIAELAAKLNINRTTYWNYEQGISIPNFEKLLELAKFFSISVDTLLNSDVTANLPEIVPAVVIIDGRRGELAIDKQEYEEAKSKHKKLVISVTL